MTDGPFFQRWIPRRNKAIPDASVTEAMSRTLRNLQGFEQTSEFTRGGLQITNEIIGTPFLCSPAFNVAGTKIDRVIIGAFRSGAEYNFRDFIHLQLFGDTYAENLVDQTIVGPEIVTVTGPGMVYYEIVWDGIASPTITPGFQPGFVLPVNSDTVRNVPLAFVELGTDSNLLYLRQVQVGVIKEYFHACCTPGPEPGICPDDCDDCSGVSGGFITVTSTGFTGTLCSCLNGTRDLFFDGTSIPARGCVWRNDDNTGDCSTVQGNPHSCDNLPWYRGNIPADVCGDFAVGLVCCDGLWQLSLYWFEAFGGSPHGFRTARFFAEPDAGNNGCPPLTDQWFLETTVGLGVCTDCVSDCLQCLSGGSITTS